MRAPVATLLALDVVAQLLVLQHGFAVLTNGAAYRVAPGVAIVDAKTGKPGATPIPGTLVRLTIDDNGVVNKIASNLPAPRGGAAEKLVAVTFTVRVPSSTQAGDTVYLTDNEQRWDPVATRMDRVDLLRFRTVLAVPAGAAFRYLYTRGGGQTIELGTNGTQRKPRTLQVNDLTARHVDDVVERWGDEVGNTLLPQPHESPTPFNPAPYPNVPTPNLPTARRRL
jgi:hypothetical protein